MNNSFFFKNSRAVAAGLVVQQRFAAWKKVCVFDLQNQIQILWVENSFIVNNVRVNQRTWVFIETRS